MFERKNYTALSQDGHDSVQIKLLHTQTRSTRLRLLVWIALLLFCTTCSGLLGYISGQQKHEVSRDGWISNEASHVLIQPLAKSFLEPDGSLRYKMHFNGSFPRAASPTTDALWDSLFPSKFGFVQHPIISPDVSGIAMFHELHCLVSSKFVSSYPKL